MRLEAIYDNGTLEMPTRLRFHHNRFKVLVEVPDEEIMSEKPSSLDDLLSQNPNDPWLQRMKAIEMQVLSTPDDQLPDLTAKQLDRIEAFALREDR